MSLVDVAEKALLRGHNIYGEEFRLLKYIPTATGGIYRQRKRAYESPYTLIGSISRAPTEELLTPIGEGSQRTATLTIPISSVKKLFGNSTALEKMITSSDLIIFDKRVWRITQSALTGRLKDRPLFFSILLREKLGEKEVEYL